MANSSHETETRSLQGLVVRLAGEIDYKNHILMQMEANNATIISVLESENADKDKLLSKKSADITILIEEKDRMQKEMLESMKEKERLANEEKNKLQVEKSAIISALVEDKKRLLDEISIMRNALKVKEERRNHEYEGITALKTQISEKDRLIADISSNFINLRTEKDQLLEAYMKELESSKNLRLEHEKLQHKLRCEKERSITRDKMKIKEEKLDYESTSVAMLVRPNAEKNQLIRNSMAEKELGKSKNTNPENLMLEHYLENQKKERRLIKRRNSGGHEKISADVEKFEGYMKTVNTKSDLLIQEFKAPKSSITKKRTDVQRMEEFIAEMNSLRQQLEEKEESLQHLEDHNRILMVNEATSNQELQAARNVRVLKTFKIDECSLGSKELGIWI